jgi:type VI protein secretion system component VasK
MQLTLISIFVLLWPIFLLWLQNRRQRKRISGLEHQINVQSREKSRLEQRLYSLKTVMNEALDNLNKTKSGEGQYTLRAKQIIGDVLKKERYSKIIGREPKEKH